RDDRSGYRRSICDLRCARRGDRLEYHHLALRHSVEFVACADRRIDRFSVGEVGVGLIEHGRLAQDSLVYFYLAAARFCARVAAHAGGVMDVFPDAALQGGPAVHAVATDIGGGVYTRGPGAPRA